MKIFTLAAFLLTSLSLAAAYASHTVAHTPIEPEETKVVVCTGSYAKKYHSHSNCAGLNNCKGNRETINLSAAQKQGRTSCSKCY
jgi:threonine synthase